MKKIILIALSLLVLMAPSFAMIGVSAMGAYYSYAGSSSTGYGLELELPILPIPFAISSLQAIYIPINATSYLAPITLNAKFDIPATPFYLGADIGYLLYSQTTANFTFPGALTYGVLAGYKHNLMPTMDFFAQAGYEIMDVTYKVGAVEFSNKFSGLSVKAGLKWGI